MKKRSTGLPNRCALCQPVNATLYLRNMPTIDSQVNYWDQVAEKKVFGHPINFTKFKSFVSGSSAILDYGCGYGRVCEELRKNGFTNVLGVDTSKNMIDKGLREYPQLDLRFLEGSILPFSSCSFDAVFLFTVLTSTPSDDAQKKLITESHRVLRPNGLIYLSDLPLQKDKRNQQRYLEYEKEFETYGVFRLPDGGIMRHHELSHFETLLSKFDIIESNEIDVHTMNGNSAKGIQWFARKV